MASARLAQKGGLGAEPQRHTPRESPARNRRKGMRRRSKRTLKIEEEKKVYLSLPKFKPFGES